MINLSRKPDWDQEADRHSDLFDPVLTVRQLSRFDHRKGYSRIDNALVFTTDKGAYDVYLPPHRPTRSRFAAKRYTAVYEVDMGVHLCTVDLLLPSDNDAFDFTSHVEMTWQVSRPEQFVDSRERDVPALLRRRLEQLMCPVSRGFPVDRSAEAERAVRRAVDGADEPGEHAGLRTSYTVRLRPDDAATAHQQELRRIRYSDEQLTHSHELALRENCLRAEENTNQAKHEHDLVMLQGRQQKELRELEAEKIRHYEYYLQRGGVATWAMHLAQQQEDSRLVLENLSKHQMSLIRQQADVALQVLKEGKLEDYQRGGFNEYAVEFLKGLLAENSSGESPVAPVPDLPWSGSADVPVQVRKPTDGMSPDGAQGER